MIWIVIAIFVYLIYRITFRERQLLQWRRQFQYWDALCDCRNLAEMAAFCDQVTATADPDEDDDLTQLEMIVSKDPKYLLQVANTTSLGNMAFCCLHSPIEHRVFWRQAFKRLITVNKLPFVLQDL